MRYSWSEMRDRARAFSDEWADASDERRESHSFWNEFFEVFGVRRRSVARYEEQVKRLDDSRGYIDLFWPGRLLVEQKSEGRSLADAAEQAGSYFDALRESDRPRWLLLSDFRHFELRDLDEGVDWHIPLSALAENIEQFAFIADVDVRRFREQDPANVDASELVGSIYEQLHESGYVGDDLHALMVRLVFCLFADNTGIFERDLFLNLIDDRTRPDGSDVGGWLCQLFDALNTPEADRQTILDEDLAKFPYINGDLFDGAVPPPAFNRGLREALLDAARFDWSRISPAIFGALFQSVMDGGERRRSGAHYTTEQNILKVIEPLFLDELRAEFERAKARAPGRGRTRDLRQLQRRIAGLTVLDPACGCGNFLIIAYRELRELEIDILKELYPADRRTAALDVAQLSLVNVDHFYGIELLEFPAKIAETALWMMDHLMNRRLGREFGRWYTRIPLRASPHIARADALEIDWNEVLPARQCSYVLGNPPFGGFVYRDGGKRQQAKQRLRDLGAIGARLDYVAAWFLKAGDYFRGRNARIAFVATNSISQGEQVPQLWPALFDRYGLEITFAHSTFRWGSEAPGMAHVDVVIVGMANRGADAAPRRLFTYDAADGEPRERTLAAISPYLIDASGLADPRIVVRRARSRSDDLPSLRVGTKPVDGGHYVLDDDARRKLIEAEPSAAEFVRPFLGSRELIHGESRWIVNAPAIPPDRLRQMPLLRRMVRATGQYRRTQAGALGQSLAGTPRAFHVENVPDAEFIAIPETSAHTRDYVPIGWLVPPAIPSNALLVIEEPQMWHFALLTSAMHMAWLAHIGGRLRTDFRYSNGLVYCTFPVPDLTERRKSRLDELGRSVLEARAEHSEATLADLYDRDSMPKNLAAAHAALDRAVDAMYRRTRFRSRSERIEHLLGRYEQMIAPLPANGAAKRRRR